jgi:murein DD-endopeptidase MepM/ murein hydrolase activator NlpD
VKAGQRVKRGDTIAISGATGNATGPHVHYEVWKRGIPTDPTSFLEERS